MKLYSNPKTRGVSTEWYLKELGADVEVVTVDYDGKEHQKPEFTKINPFARVPAFEDGELMLFESGAIQQYLAEKLGGERYATPEGRARAAAWLFFANSTLSDALWYDKARLPTVMSQLDGVLADGRQFLSGDDFGVEDVAVGASLIYAVAFSPAEELKLEDTPRILAYLNRLAAREACQQTLYRALAPMLEGKLGAGPPSNGTQPETKAETLKSAGAALDNEQKRQRTE